VGWGTIAVIGGCVPSWLFHYLDQRYYRRAVVTALAGAVCITVTVAGSMGGLAKSGDERLAERRQAITAAKDNRAELERIQRDRDKLDPRPMGTIKAEIEAAHAGKAYKAASGCDPNMVGKASRESCDAFRRLEGDLAAAETAAAWTQIWLVCVASKAPVMQATDPGAAVVAALIGTTAENAAAWTIFLGSIALELAGMNAMMRADAPGRQLEALAVPLVVDPPNLGVPRLDRPRPATVDSFMLACVIPAKRGKVPWAELFTRYRRWCSEWAPESVPLDAATFGRRLDAFHSEGIIRTRKQGEDVFRIDVKLVA
jgi:hypothetical protein